MRAFPRAELEYLSLRVMHEADGAALGSWALRQRLAQAGFPVSEATAGRILHELDMRGLTARVSNRGRVLTREGVDRFRDLDAARRAFGGAAARVGLGAAECSRLVQVLQARRAIERETARFAALNATPADVGRMGETLLEQERRISAGETGSEFDMAFHRLVARASGNRFLEAAYETVSRDAELAPVYEHIRLQVKGRLVDEHRAVYRAIASGNAALAEASMIAHIDGVLHDLERYRNASVGSEGGAGVIE